MGSSLPYVEIVARCYVRIKDGVNVCYGPAPRILAPDVHVNEIVRQGRGRRLTNRGGSSAKKEAGDDARDQ